MNRTTLAAVGVFALLLVAVLMTREKNVSVGIRKLETPVIEKGTITSIELSGAKTATLVKEGDAWFVVDAANGGKKYAADDQSAQALADAAAEFKASEFITDAPEKQAELELTDAAGQRVKVLPKQGQVLDVILGKSAKSGGNYVRLANSNAVFVTRGRLAALARKDVSQWRKRSLLSVKPEELTALTVTTRNGQFLALESADGKDWKLKEGTETPNGFRFDPQAAGRIASTLSTLRTQEFLDGATGQEPNLGLVNGDKIEAKLNDGKTITVTLGNEPDARDVGAASAIKGALDGLDTDKDARLSPAELKAGAADAARPADLKKHLQWLSDDKAAFERFDVGAYSKLLDDDLISAPELEGVVKTSQLVPAMIAGDSQVYLIPNYSAQQLRKRLVDLRDLSLMNTLETDKATQVTINAGGKKTVVTKDNGAWKIVEPKTLPAGFEFDPNQVNSQLAMIKNIKGTRLVDPAPKDAETGLSKPTATVDIKLEGGKTATLKFGKDTTNEKGVKEIFVQGSVDNAVYAIGEYQRKRLESGVEVFKKPAPPPNFGAGGGMQGLENLPPDVRKKLEEQIKSGQFGR